jgi:hypothetical protein
VGSSVRTMVSCSPDAAKINPTHRIQLTWLWSGGGVRLGVYRLRRQRTVTPSAGEGRTLIDCRPANFVDTLWLERIIVCLAGLPAESPT